MTQFNLPYGDGGLPVTLPDEHLGAIISPRPVTPAADPLATIEAALSQPLGTTPLEQLVQPGQIVAVIIDDITRETPTAMMLPLVLKRLHEAGIHQADIAIVIALGTHRPLTTAEIIQKTGPEIAAAYRIVNVSCHDDEQMVYMGTSSHNIPAWVNRTVAEAEVRIGLGMITPHMDVGFSGGAKIILPGVCSALTVDTFHAREADINRNQLGDIDSPMRQDLEQFVGERVGLDFILNVILTGDEAIYKCVAGDFLQAHRQGVVYAQEVYGSPVSRRYPVVIANTFPATIDLWQSSKGLWCGDLLVEDGGTVILVTPASEGHGVYPRFAEYIGQEPEALKQKLDANAVDDPKACALGILVGRMKQRVNFALVSSGLGPDDAMQMGFAYFETVEAAVAVSVKGYEAPAVGVLTHGGVTLPLL